MSNCLSNSLQSYKFYLIEKCAVKKTWKNPKNKNENVGLLSVYGKILYTYINVVNLTVRFTLYTFINVADGYRRNFASFWVWQKWLGNPKLCNGINSMFDKYWPCVCVNTYMYTYIRRNSLMTRDYFGVIFRHVTLAEDYCFVWLIPASFI